MTNDWSQLNADETLQFLDAVRSENDAYRIFFETSICEVFKRPLDFFDGYDLIRISNQYSPPFFIMDFLSNGENHYYLDGSDHGFQSMCVQKCVRLNEDNVLEYLDMYVSYVYERGNSLVFIRDGQDTNFKGSSGMGVHFKALQAVEEISVSFDAQNDSFSIKTPLLYQDKTRKSVIKVHKNGEIVVEHPLNVHFLDKSIHFEHINLKHPLQNEIIAQTRTLLEKSETAKRLLKIADEKDVDIHILSSPNYQAITSNKPTIFMAMPAAQHTADYHQALILGGALRDMEQTLGGFPRPSLEEPTEVYFAANYDKNLNLLMEICKMVEELDTPEALEAMRRLGIEDLYKGYKSNASPDTMLQIYISMMTRQGFIIEG